MVGVAPQYADAVPAPIHAVPLDPAIVIDLHRLDEVHLLAIRRGARVFPNQLSPIGEKAFTVALPYGRRAGENETDEVAQFVVAFDNAAVGSVQMRLISRIIAKPSA